MNNKLYHDELEGFLSESAEDLRMYPSDRVWRNINKQINGYEQWPALTFGAIFTGALMLAALIFLQPDKDLFTVKHTAPLGQIPVITKPAFKVAGQAIANNFEQHDAGNQIHTPRALGNTVATVAALATVAEKEQPVTETVAASTGIPQTDVALFDAQSEASTLSLTKYLHASAVTPMTSMLYNNNAENIAAATPLVTVESSALPTGEALTKAVQPLNAKKSRWAVQYYVTPSLSYRFMSEDPSVLNSRFYGNSSGTALKHSPKTGIEAGIAFTYQVTENLRVKMGVQANYRRYAIDAYATTPQPAVIMVNQGLRMDSIVAMSEISTVRNSMPVEISNQLFQLSMPVGFELQMAKFNQARFVVAATVQPTYNVGQQSWLISANYMNYVKQPSLLRKWNVNTGIEAFMQFTGKKGLTWQVGPQIRYQLLPAATLKYPVREHLIDYGLKIGVVKTLQ